MKNNNHIPSLNTETNAEDIRESTKQEQLSKEEMEEISEFLRSVFGPDAQINAVEDEHGNIFGQIIAPQSDIDEYEEFEEYMRTCFADIDYVDLYQFLKKNIFGQDEQLLKICACLKAYFTNMSQDNREDIPFHFILAGPTGCGKTEVYRNLQKYFEDKIPELPIILRDATSLTSEGYVGEGKNYLIRDLVQTNGYGIVFIDEFDKRIINSDSGQTVNFASETQNGLLQMIDGAIMDVASEFGGAEVDTRNTLFICMGAFEKEVEEEKHPGFNNVNCLPEHKDLSYDSLIKWGCERQLAARFCQIINFNRITESVLEKIINKYICQYKKSLQCDIRMSKEYKEGLKRLYDERYGTRNIRAMIWRDLQVPYLHLKDKKHQYITLKKVSVDGELKLKKKAINR